MHLISYPTRQHWEYMRIFALDNALLPSKPSIPLGFHKSAASYFISPRKLSIFQSAGLRVVQCPNFVLDVYRFSSHAAFAPMLFSTSNNRAPTTSSDWFEMAARVWSDSYVSKSFHSSSFWSKSSRYGLLKACSLNPCSTRLTILIHSEECLTITFRLCILLKIFFVKFMGKNILDPPKDCNMASWLDSESASRYSLGYIFLRLTVIRCLLFFHMTNAEDVVDKAVFKEPFQIRAVFTQGLKMSFVTFLSLADTEYTSYLKPPISFSSLNGIGILIPSLMQPNPGLSKPLRGCYRSWQFPDFENHTIILAKHNELLKLFLSTILIPDAICWLPVVLLRSTCLLSAGLFETERKIGLWFYVPSGFLIFVPRTSHADDKQRP